jgi:serine/threonine protein kinase
MLQVLAGLNAAHAQGIVHCDLKPANIIVTHPRPDRPLVKVLDFGIARSLAEAQRVDSKPGPVLGTPLHMAPEQVLGEPMDVRTDVFSVASILWSMLTGQDAYDGTAARAVLQQVVKGERRKLLDANPRISPALAEIVERGLSLNREQRIGSAGDFAELLWPFVALERVLSFVPLRQLSSDPIPLVPLPSPPRATQRSGAQDPRLPESSIIPVRRKASRLPDALLLSPKIPRAPTTPRLDSARDLRFLRSSVTWQPVIREKSSWAPATWLGASTISAVLATALGFGIGILLACLTGVI